MMPRPRTWPRCRCADVALSPSRILVSGDTPYPWEREGIAFVESVLPNNDPFYVWEPWVIS